MTTHHTHTPTQHNKSDYTREDVLAQLGQNGHQRYNDPRRAVPAPKPTLLQPTPGSDITAMAVTSLAEAGIPLLVLTRSLELAEQIKNDLHNYGIIAHLHRGHQDPDDMETCSCPLEIVNDRTAQVVVATKKAYTQSLCDLDIKGQPLQDRIVVVVDLSDAAHGLSISLNDLTEIRQRVRDMEIENETKGTIITYLRDISDAVEVTQLTADDRARHITTAAQKICAEIVPDINKLGSGSIITSKTVDWSGEQVDVLLRMAFSLYQAGQYNGIMIEKNTTIRAFLPAPWYLDAVNGKIFLIMIDATPPQGIIEGVKNMGGEIIRVGF